MDMGFVAAAATLRQSIAEPMLRFPGLTERIAAMVAPKYTLELSEAGRRALVCADVIGTRTELISVLPTIHPLLREFSRATSADRDLPDRDGLRVTGLGNVLTLDGCERVLGYENDRTRETLDRLLEAGALRRGLVLRCGYCSGRDFYSIDDLGQQYQCRRCANRTDVARGAWTEDRSEPAWCYSLHGTFRDLIGANGDVPLLAAAHLAAKGPHYADVPELDFRSADKTATLIEIDLIAVVDGELVVAEAKRSPKAVKNRRSLDKLVHLAATIHADTIALASGSGEPWPDTLIDYLRGRINARRHAGRRRPRLVTFTGLFDVTAVETEH